jgi:hypothetical protein
MGEWQSGSDLFTGVELSYERNHTHFGKVAR